jgi:hypothetical protein
MGPISDDGPGQNNPDRSEGPWGRAALAALTVVFYRASSSDSERSFLRCHGEHEGRRQTGRYGKTVQTGKALSDTPALEPYRGKPAVRNLREGNGDVGIIRSPVRAIALPDRCSCAAYPRPRAMTNAAVSQR